MLEFAFADAAITPDGGWSEIMNAKTSLWLTPSYRWNIGSEIAFVDLIGVMRYTRNKVSIDKKQYADFGIKAQMLRKRIGISFETVTRLAYETTSDARRTSRNALTLSYKLNDLVTFKSTFGSNFDGNSRNYDKPEPAFIVGGLNFAFSELRRP